jgi:hypothetical protein
MPRVYSPHQRVGIKKSHIYKERDPSVKNLTLSLNDKRSEVRFATHSLNFQTQTSYTVARSQHRVSSDFCILQFSASLFLISVEEISI